MNETDYFSFFSRNRGLISDEQQEKLKSSCVAVFGLGGLGGIICEILVRSGITNLKLIDKDVFETSNLNRQIYAHQHSLGRSKTKVTKEALLKINPGLSLISFNRVGEDNIDEILIETDLALLALDETLACITISRAAQKQGIPLVEGWALPFLNVRVYTRDTPSLEQVYNLPTEGRSVKDISEKESAELNLKMLLELKNIEGIEAYYDENIINQLQDGNIPSFAPVVWLNACYMSLEAIKVLLGRGTISYAPKMTIFDPFDSIIL